MAVRRQATTKGTAAPKAAAKGVAPVRTYGLTHIALAVRDPARSLQFYSQVFGMVPVYRSDEFVQMQTPGTRDVLVFEKKPHQAGRPGGVAHFGFRLTSPADIAAAVQAVEAAGGKILKTGNFIPGEPYLFAADPDGYEFEIWFELPTPVDPPTPRRAKG